MSTTSLSKNFAPLCIYFILKKHSNINNKLTQNEIAQYLLDEYGITLERKAIGRIVDNINESLDIEIGKDRKGCWFDDPDDFQESELHLLIDSLFCCRYVPENYTKDLIKKLCNLGSEYFNPRVKYTYSTDNLSKNNNKAVFTNIELVDKAIATHKQISFDFNKWGIDHKLHKTSEQIASPFRMVVHSGKYYLKGYDERHKSLFYYRLDHITNMQILEKSKATSPRSIKGFENGIENKHLGSNLPYMYTDKEESITFLAIPGIIDQVVDWLGDSVQFNPQPMPDGRYKASIISSPMAMKFFFIQYSEELECIAPKHLRDDVSEIIQKAAKKYSK